MNEHPVNLNLPMSLRTKLAPPTDDLTWLHEWARQMRPRLILEFGCGATTYALQMGAEPSEHVCIEDWEESIDTVRALLPGVHIVADTLANVPALPYDAVVIDSSALILPKGTNGVMRDEAVRFAETLAHPHALYALHDWCPGKCNSGQGARRYLEAQGYTLIDYHESSRGWGVYQK